MGRIKLYCFTEDEWVSNDLGSRLPISVEPQVMYLTLPVKVKRSVKQTDDEYIKETNEWFAQDQRELREKFTHYSTEKERARLWLIANPNKRRPKRLAFLTGWLLRSAPANKGVEVKPVIRSL